MKNNNNSTCPYCGANLKRINANMFRCEFCGSTYPAIQESRPTYHTSMQEPDAKKQKQGKPVITFLLLAVSVCLISLAILCFYKENDISSYIEENVNTNDKEFSLFFSEVIPAMYEKDIDELTAKDFEQLIRFEYQSENSLHTVTYQLKDQKPQTFSVKNYETATPEDLAYFPKLESLSWSGFLYGDLPKLPNLKELRISSTEIEKVISLCNDPKQLEILEINAYSGNIAGLEQFSNLKELYLTSDSLESIEQLKYLTNLTVLVLDCGETSSFMTKTALDSSPLKSCKKLKELHIKNTGMKDFSFLKEVSELTTLELYNTKILSLEPIKNNKKLEKLMLDRNDDLTDCEIIDTLTGLCHLEFDIPDEDQTPSLKKLSKLTHLKVDGCSAGNFSFLSNAKKLTYLDIRVWGDDVTSDLAKLKKLTYLKLEVASWHSYYDTIHFENLYKLKNLKTLDLSGSDMDTEISAVFSIPNLKELNLNDCSFIDLDYSKIKANKTLKVLKMDRLNETMGSDLKLDSNLKFLKKFPNLQELSIAGNKLTSLSGISGLKKLKILDIRENYITSLEPLQKLKHLETVTCGNNAISGDLDLGEDVTVSTEEEGYSFHY